MPATPFLIAPVRFRLDQRGWDSEEFDKARKGVLDYGRFLQASSVSNSLCLKQNLQSLSLKMTQHHSDGKDIEVITTDSWPRLAAANQLRVELALLLKANGSIFQHYAVSISSPR